MSKLDPLYQTLLKTMVDYPTRDNVLPKYQIIVQKIDQLFAAIKDCSDQNMANPYFDQLQEIQESLSVLIFKEKIDDYISIDNFVRDFDRIDDDWLRQRMFQEIKFKGYSIHDQR